MTVAAGIGIATYIAMKTRIVSSGQCTIAKGLLVALLMAGAISSPTRAHAQELEEEPGRGHAGDNNVLRFQGARLTPRGDGDYWSDNELTFTGSAEDFEDVSLTVDYQRMAGSRFAIMLSGGYYEGSLEQAYLDFADDAGADIVHTTTLERVAFTAGLLLYPVGRDAAVSPYLGGGLAAHLWRLEEAGDFINFNSNPPAIFHPSPFTDEEVTFGSFWVVGLEIPLVSNWAAFAEARWQRAEQELGGGFNGFGELDLSSREIGVGVSVSF